MLLGVCTELWHNAYWNTFIDRDLLLFRSADIDWQRGQLREAFYSPCAGQLHRLAAVPLPQIIYDYSLFLNESEHQRLRQLGVCCVFNHFGAPFDKWSLHQRLASCPRLSSALPETSLYRTPEDARQLLQRYSMVLLKPLGLSRGRGIVLLDKKQVLTGSWQSRLLPAVAYVVQQKVDLLTLQGRTVDFRLYLQRNEYGTWQVSAAAARQAAAAGQLLTNLALGGRALPPQMVLQNQDNSRLRGEAQLLWQKICTLALETARQTDQSYRPTIQNRHSAEQGWMAAKAVPPGNLNRSSGSLCPALLGELGIDIGVDQSGRVWLLEVNNKPGKTCLNCNQQALLQALQTPVKFARYLQKTLA